jgi:outer membrane protein TolC
MKRNGMKRPWILALLLPWHVWAQPSLQHLLPPVARVQEVLLASPQIQGARHHQQAQEARALQQAIGPHEFGVRLNQQSRHVQDPTQTYGETLLTLERPLRWWNKGQTDQQLSEQSRTIARVAYADALHEGSRRLLAQWLSAWRARVVFDSAEEQWRLSQTLEQQSAARLRQGDISRLDAELARAESQRVSVQRDVAQSEWVRAQALLTRLYPGLGVPGPLPSLDQLTPLEPQEVLREDFLRKHHELNLMRAETSRAALTARRHQQEQLPDPTLGVFTARERMGAERVLGVSLGMPLPGASRQHLAAAAQADASAWEDRVRQAELEFGAEFDRRWLSARDLRQSLARMTDATRIQQQAANQALRAYSLGESSMTDVLQHRRWADEQRKALQLMQLDVLEQLAFIELDLHRLWDLD